MWQGSSVISGRLTTFGLVLALAVGSPVMAMEEAATEDPVSVEDLQRHLAELQKNYETQIAALEARIVALEAGQGEAQNVAAPVEPSQEDELAALRAAAVASASSAQSGLPDVAPAPGRQRSLNRLNPEISTTGIISAIGSDADREEFERGEFEVDLQSTLDPYSKMRFTIAFTEEGEVEVEEGYLTYTSLPGGLELTAGKFRQRFGALNRQHVHALPQTGFPLALATVFGDEGLGQTGLSATWLLPKPWASANEISLEVTDGQSEFFGGEDFEDLSVLGRIKNFWEISDATYFEWGLSGILGKTELGNDSEVWGTDMTFHWQPPSRAKYREFTWRTEVLLSEREDEFGLSHQALGGYTYFEGLVARNLYVGTRFDWTEDPLDPLAEKMAIVPYLTWWQSEWVRLRSEYQYIKDELTGETENRFALQLTWAAGPHKHESY
jgi:hypothetical protein